MGWGFGGRLWSGGGRGGGEGLVVGPIDDSRRSAVIRAIFCDGCGYFSRNRLRFPYPANPHGSYLD